MKNWILALAVVITPLSAPHVIWSDLDLDQQLAYIQAIRPEPKPVVLPTKQYRPARPIEPDWMRELVSTYFQPEDVEWALRVSWCESRWDANAKNPNSSASGLFQHLATYWEGRAAQAGYPGGSIWDPAVNTAVAAWLYYTGGPQHWVCK